MSNDNIKARVDRFDTELQGVVMNPLELRLYELINDLYTALQLSQEQNKVAVEALEGIVSDQVESIFLMRVIAEEALAKIKAMGEA